MEDNGKNSSSLNNIVLTIASSWPLQLTTISAILLVYWYFRRPSGIPPGPRGLPFVGYLPWLGKKPYVTFNKIAAKYKSPIFSLYLGNRLVIVLNNYDAIYAALVKQANNFSGRIQNFSTSIHKTNKSLLTNDGELWSQHRQFMLSHLRDLGLGKSLLEPQILDEIGHCVEELKSYKGQPTDFRDLIGMSVANNISILEFGRRFEYTDANFVALKRCVDALLASANAVTPLTFLPWLKPLTSLWGSEVQQHNARMIAEFQDHLCRMVADHRTTHKENDKSNYVGAYLTEQKYRNETNEDSTYFTEEVMYHNIRMMFSAGTDTTAVTLLWGLIYMMKYPDIQKKVQAELDLVVGRDRMPSFNDCPRTPYTEATIFEIERTVSLLPLNLPHRKFPSANAADFSRNLKECQVLGYRIPKSSYIVTNLWSVHNDPALWEEPFRFNPERFLTEDKRAQRPPYLIPFSLGKRECLGKPLARMELYLYFASLLQAFTFQMPEGETPNMDATMGITLVPNEFLSSAIPRF